MKFIIHRINTIEKLKKIPKEYGCEIDIRSNGSNLILNHDPFKNGDFFNDYLDEYKHDTLILNIKESGIEDLVLQEVKKRNIKKFFLLDVEIPYLYKAVKNRERNIAVRFSEIESIEQLKLFSGKLNWAWIDTITSLPIMNEDVEVLKKYLCCLVCPSRWGRESNIKEYIQKIISFGLEKNLHIMTELDNIKRYYV
jgi:hypothetical protein